MIKATHYCYNRVMCIYVFSKSQTEQIVITYFYIIFSTYQGTLCKYYLNIHFLSEQNRVICCEMKVNIFFII